MNTDGFLSLLLSSGVLRFGEFQTKSGRQSPYFFNMGHFDSAYKMKELSGYYAEKIFEVLEDKVDVLYGPAYKGIPLCVSVSQKLSDLYKRDVAFTFNRKEAKAHGEKGFFVGHTFKEGDRVLIIEDVLTGGTSLRETFELLKDEPIEIIGAIVGVDREEKGLTNLRAREEIEKNYKVAVYSILDIDSIVKRLYNREFNGKIWIDGGMKQSIDEYAKKYRG